MLIKVNFNTPPNADQWREFLGELVNRLNMNILIEPMVVYSDNPGNEGETGFVCIDTSHCSFHSWPHVDEPFAMIDVYSCKCYDADVVISFMKEKFDVLSGHYTMIDREVKNSTF